MKPAFGTHPVWVQVGGWRQSSLLLFANMLGAT